MENLKKNESLKKEIIDSEFSLINENGKILKGINKLIHYREYKRHKKQWDVYNNEDFLFITAANDTWIEKWINIETCKDIEEIYEIIDKLTIYQMTVWGRKLKKVISSMKSYDQWWGIQNGEIRITHPTHKQNFNFLISLVKDIKSNIYRAINEKEKEAAKRVQITFRNISYAMMLIAAVNLFVVIFKLIQK